MITLGDKVKDRVSGLVGIATAEVRYLNGCIQFAIEPKIKPGGKLISHYIDEGQLVKMKGGLNDTPKKKGEASPSRHGRLKRKARGGHGGGPQGHRTPPGGSDSSSGEYSE